MVALANIGVLPRPVHPSGVWSWLTTVDHKRIGLLYGFTALAFSILGGIESLIIRAQLTAPNQSIVSPETYNSLFTMHGTTMVFMVVMPAGAAFFNYMVPLQIGARDVAFPRLNAFSYWLFLFGALLMNFSFFVGAFPDIGWFGYAPLTTNEYTTTGATDYWLLGLQVMGIGSLAAGFNFAVTILNLRAPGMTLMRMPLFTWMTLIVAFLLILAFPPLTIALTFLLFDRFFDTNFFNTSAGADPLLWQHLFWIFGHPEVYVLILPAMGIVSDVLPTFSRKPLFGYPMIVFAGLVIGFLGFGVWAHHMFTTGLGGWASAAFAGSTMVIAVPTGVKLFNWLGTMWGGSLRFKTPMLFAVGFIAMFLLGGLSGVMHAVVPVDTQQQDTYFIVAHFHYVLVGGSIFGLMAGLYYWWPKMTGRMLSERLGKWHFWLMFAGFNITFFPMHFLGVIGMPRRIYTYDADQGWAALNALVSAGSLVLAFSILLLLVNLAISLRRGEKAGDNPWEAPSLEWATSSPPHHYNFAVVPTVRSRYPLWDEEANVVEPPPLPPYEEPHMPSPSYWPIMLAFAIVMLAVGLLIWQWHALIGIGFIVVMMLLGLRSIYGWVYEPPAVEAPAAVHAHT
ncbi:MAG: cytochrome c oxidase subunit I [Chloroflexi bacterium]|nr:cytochrome c oxidase subunit I [Chloroflexota bacterium]